MADGFDQQLGKKLLALARLSLEERLGVGPSPMASSDPLLVKNGASFVTLTLDGALCGCIGSLTAHSPLWQDVCNNARNAAFNDQRFSPLCKEDLDRLSIEVSLLTDPQQLDYRDGEDLLAKLSPGEDGVVIKDGSKQATFLPQVWQQLPTPAEFLQQLCLKAGLASDIWQKKKLVVEIYRVQAFHEEK